MEPDMTKNENAAPKGGSIGVAAERQLYDWARYAAIGAANEFKPADNTTVQVINNGGQGRLALMYRVVVDGREGNWFLGPSEYVAALVADLAAASASRAFAPRNTDPGDVGERLASLDSWLLNHEERIARLEREREHRR